ncbi:MAG: hypothetical protein Q9217_001260 [Psora testacea]
MDTPSPLDPLDPYTPSRHSPTWMETTEKALPPAPLPSDPTRSETAVAAVPANANGSFSQRSRQSLNGHPSLHRAKKRVISKRSKACIIALPLENDHSQTTSRQDPLKPREVSKRLKEWEDKGYDTTASVLASATTEPAPFSFRSQSRAVHPDPEDEKNERSKRSYRVNVPDWREWEAYVSRLQEEKLRALGVSSGDEDLSSKKSPAPSLMSRQASPQRSVALTSPLLQASSMPPNPFGPSLTTRTNLPDENGVSHFPRYSVTVPFSDKGLQPPVQFSQSNSPVHHDLSPFGDMSLQSNSRMSSPSTSKHMASSYASLSPAPSAARNSLHPVSSRDSNESLAPMRQQAASLQAHGRQQQHHQQQTLQPLPKPDTGTVRYSNSNAGLAYDRPYYDIVTPMPLGYCGNPSECLQREVEEAEAYFEAVEQENEELEKSQRKGEKEVSEGQEAAAQMQPSEVRNWRIKVPDGEDDIMHSAESTKPQNVANRPQSKHGSKSSSSSRLNVNAPEYKSEPAMAIAPDTFSSLEKEQRPRSSQGLVLLPPSNIGHARKASVSRPSPRFNVAAPVFIPGSAAVGRPNGPSRVFSFGADQASSTKADYKANAAPRQFSFSSKAPTLNPDAPVFMPIEPMGAANDAPTKENAIEEVKKIFGDFNFTNVIKPTRKSKALPIIEPEQVDKTGGESDAPEDESGRITQSDARQKRLRRDHDGADQVPQFATPNDILWLSNIDGTCTVNFSNTQSSSSGKGEPTTREAATDLLEEIIDISASEASSIMRDEPTKTNERPVVPPMFYDVDQAASFKVARPPSLSREDSVERMNPMPNDTAEATKELLQKSPQLRSELDHRVQHRLSRSPSTSISPNDYRHKRHSRDGRINRVDRARQAAPLRQDVLDGVRYVEPSFPGIDAIVKDLNSDRDSDIDIKRSSSPRRSHSPIRHHSHSPHRELQESVSCKLLLPANGRSDPPFPSPNRLREPFQYLPPTDTESVDSAAGRMVARNARYSPSFRPSKNSRPVHRLNSPGSTTPSDWNDAISSIDETQFKSRTGFFDNKVNDLIGDVLQQRLGPLEKTLSSIQRSLVTLSKRTVSRTTSRRPRSSGTIEVLSSDADDEDDTEEASQSRLRSPLRGRKYDQLKASISELAAAQQNFGPSTQLVELLDAINELKASISQAPRTTVSTIDIKHVVEEAVNRQMRGKSVPVVSTSQAAAAEKGQLQIAGLESMLKIAETRAEEEMKARRATEDALADYQRLLRQALHEAAQQRESAEATERSLQEYYEERQHNLKHTAVLEGTQESLETRASELSEKNEALESTLAEYRLSHDQWRTDIDNLRHENKDLHRNLRTTKAELENSVEDRSSMRAKFDQLRENIASASSHLTADHAHWRSKEEEHKNRLDILGTRLEAEARIRMGLELQIERLEAHEKESMKARLQLEQTHKANAHLDKLVGQLRSESHDHQNAAARLERELRAAQETSIMEVHRTRSAMEVDIKAAKSEIRVVRAGLQDTIYRLEQQLEDATSRADMFKTQYEIMLKEASEARRAALQEAADAHDKTLQEHYRFHEQAVKDMKVQHRRALDNALEDKQRSETYLGNRISLADEKILHLQDKVIHLAEKLEIAKSAAHAAVQAVQANKAASSPSASRALITKASDIPEKISPQALRESILVLQEQLQARESRIEELEANLTALDPDAPAKLKDANFEITWLRELLGVRIDDLQDIITTLSQPSYDREAVKDAAIRLKANLQMVEQENERALSGSHSFPSPLSISNLAASPKALPSAAAAAWGSWRKGRDTGTSNLGAIAKGSVNRTPSKLSPSPQSFFASLITPPSTNMRNPMPLQHGVRSRPTSSLSPNKPLGDPSTSRPNMSLQDEDCALGQHGRPQQDLVTPPLMRKTSYDLDAAEAAVFGAEGEEQYKKGDHEVAEEDEPFGPRIGTHAA